MIFEKSSESLRIWLVVVTMKFWLAVVIFGLSWLLMPSYGLLAGILLALVALKTLHDVLYVWFRHQTKLIVETDFIKLVRPDATTAIRWGEIIMISLSGYQGRFLPYQESIKIASAKRKIKFMTSHLDTRSRTEALDLIQDRMNQFLLQRQASGEQLAIVTLESEDDT